jgi:hypothetical protein
LIIFNTVLSSAVWHVTWKEAIRAYVFLIIISSVAYGLFALAYLALVGGL